MNIDQLLTESDTDNNDVKSQIEQQIQYHQTEDSDWRFYEVGFMIIHFLKDFEWKVSNF